jgi:hypothetical protein
MATSLRWAGPGNMKPLLAVAPLPESRPATAGVIYRIGVHAAATSACRRQLIHHWIIGPSRNRVRAPPRSPPRAAVQGNGSGGGPTEGAAFRGPGSLLNSSGHPVESLTPNRDVTNPSADANGRIPTANELETTENGTASPPGGGGPGVRAIQPVEVFREGRRGVSRRGSGRLNTSSRPWHTRGRREREHRSVGEIVGKQEMRVAPFETE